MDGAHPHSPTVTKHLQLGTKNVSKTTLTAFTVQ